VTKVFPPRDATFSCKADGSDLRNDLVFISWAPHCSRSDSIAARLGGRSFHVYSPFWGSRYATILFKYLVQAFRTLAILRRHRPRIVFVMAPPVLACLPVWLYAGLCGAKYVIDAHTGAFLESPWKRLRFLQRFFSRRAETTVVTNRHLQEMVEGWGADATIVTDVPVCFAEPERVELEGDCNMTVVASFCADEPIDRILEAAARVPEVQFHVTGDVRDVDAEMLERKPGNVRFTGFLSDARYVGQLQASDAAVVLTTRDHTMQRGAYEAVYLGKPVVTSDFQVLRQAFPKGTVHVGPTTDDLVEGIRRMHADLERYGAEVEQLRREKLRQWDQVAERLAERLGVDKPDPVGRTCTNSAVTQSA
jgi:glycosyltransferase involved in cell wall biosynthesis